MKKINALLSSLLIAMVFSSICSAMQFQQPVSIGSFAGAVAGGPRDADRWSISEEVRVTRDALIMGRGNTALLFKYKDTVWGDDNRKSRTITSIVSGNGNVFPNKSGYIGPNHDVYQINGEDGVVAYVDLMFSGSIAPSHMKIIGLWKEGKPVTFVQDVYYLADGVPEPYFYFKDKEMKVVQDTICIPYILKSGECNRQFVRNGELRFKWDDKAYWFGIEDVIF